MSDQMEANSCLLLQYMALSHDTLNNNLSSLDSLISVLTWTTTMSIWRYFKGKFLYDNK